MIINLKTKAAFLTAKDVARLNKLIADANEQIKRAEQVLQERGYSNDNSKKKHRVVEADFKRLL